MSLDENNFIIKQQIKCLRKPDDGQGLNILSCNRTPVTTLSKVWFIRKTTDHHQILVCGHRGHDCMVVGFTTTCAINIYHH